MAILLHRSRTIAVSLAIFAIACSLPHSSFAITSSNTGPIKQSKGVTRIFPEARITVYWQNSDSSTRALQSSSGVWLKNGKHVAVDPSLIPYGSKVFIKGWGTYIAVDTGSAVIKRTAARKMGKDVPVLDVFFSTKAEALKAVKNNPVFSKVEIISGPAARA